MIILNGKKQVFFDREKLQNKISGYEKVILDIGTGDGRNVYKKAKNDQTTFYIGVDPVSDNMEEIAVKLTKKTDKGGLHNVLLVISTAENLPDELNDVADSITVFFPWGTLLEGVVKPTEEIISKIHGSAKGEASFEFVTTYSDSYEDTTILSRQLPMLSESYFLGDYKELLSGYGLIVESVEILNNDYAKSFDSKWAKKLAYGRRRDFYRITGHIEK